MPPSSSQKFVQVCCWGKKEFSRAPGKVLFHSIQRSCSPAFQFPGIRPFTSEDLHYIFSTKTWRFASPKGFAFTKSFANMFRYHRFVVGQHLTLVKLGDKTAARCWRWHATGPDRPLFLVDELTQEKWKNRCVLHGRIFVTSKIRHRKKHLL